jgi:hypothetical protein
MVGAVSIGPFERSRWRLRRTRSGLWVLVLPLIAPDRSLPHRGSSNVSLWAKAVESVFAVVAVSLREALGMHLRGEVGK